MKVYKPITPGMRFLQTSSFNELTKKKPEKNLLQGKKSSSGRGSSGRISVRRRGGGHKRRYRMVDFLRNKHDIPASVKAIEYDPNRSSHIALLFYKDGVKSYILAPRGLKPGDDVLSGPKVDLRVGNHLPLDAIPLGTAVHNIELRPGQGGKIVRAAGTSATVMAKEGGYATLKLASGEVRMIHRNCYASVGAVGNEDLMNTTLGKAGRARWLGRRPKVRGVAMNPHDHPHGGGEGKTSGGRHPVSPHGLPTKGYKTRKKKNPSSRYIVKRRK